MSKNQKSKWLYRFQINKTVEVEEEEFSKNDKGEEIKITKKVEKTIPVDCALKKPNRRLFEEGEMYYAVELSKNIQAGMLTKTLLAKRFANDGGVLTDNEKDYYSDLYSDLRKKEIDLQKIQLNSEEESDEKRLERVQDIVIEISEIRQKLVEFESEQSALFDQTAEHKAKNKSIMWWVLHMSHIRDEEDQDGNLKYRPLFGGGSLEDKLDKYDEYDEEEDMTSYLIEAVKKFSYFVSFWYSGQAVDKDSFDEAANILKAMEVEETPPDEEENIEPTEEEIKEMEEKVLEAIEEAKANTEAEKETTEEKPEEKTEEPSEEKPEEEAEETSEEQPEEETSSEETTNDNEKQEE